MNVMQYSNGWGHLIMSIVTLFTMGALMYLKVVDAVVGMPVISLVVAFWFMSGTANRFNNTLNPTATGPLPAVGENKTHG